MENVILTCSCSEGPYLGAQKMGTPVTCERCRLMTKEQLRVIKYEAWEEAAETISDWMWNNPSPSGIPIDPPRNPYEEV